ncbi:hypothetical protein HZA38_03725 [Candidatus Peregrinibacteria bacterium]|nr:hypothetical protein [Candidatus Peregrinibacteria bacterium]
MFTLHNTELEALLKQSVVLRAKLSEQQREIFIARAMSLPPQGQGELITMLQKEMEEMGKNKADVVQRDLETLHTYQKNTKKTLQKFERGTFHNAESLFEIAEEKNEEDLLKKLDDISEEKS